MKIEDFKSEKKANRKRISMTVRWEDCGHEDFEVYFETDEKYAEDFSSNPNAALLAYLIPALRHGEKRIFMNAEICPELKDGANTAMSWICHWYYGDDRRPLRIEAKTRSKILTTNTRERAGVMFSGGVDSLASLRTNRLNIPLEHPGSVKDGIMAFGFDVRSEKAYEELVDSLSDVVEETGITLIPLYSNLYTHYRILDSKLLEYYPSVFAYQYQGAAVAGAAHLFTKRLDVVNIASSLDITNLEPFGSHPLLDPYFSSHDLQIRHDNIALSRVDKVKLIADWNVGLQIIRVCNHPKPGRLNCGKCWKCINTELSLLVSGALHKTPAFPNNDISKEIIISMSPVHGQSFPQFVELIAPLTEIGRDDLVRALEDKIAIYYESKRKKLRTKIAEFDRKYLMGGIRKLKESVLPQ